jgi:hypothetical protein
VKSVRLDPVLEKRLKRAAAASHLTESEIIRQGVEMQCDEILGTNLYEQIKPFIGTFRSSGEPVAERVSKVFGDMVDADYGRQLATPRKRKSS